MRCARPLSHTTHPNKTKQTNDHSATFPLFSKVDVNGAAADPVWAWLKSEKGGVLGSDVKWNFTS